MVGAFALTESGRAHGSDNSLVFGAISLLLSFISLVKLPEENKWMVFLTIFCSAFGFLAVLLSQSRGVWLAIPVLGFILLYSWSKSYSGFIKLKWVAVFLSVFFGCLFVAYSSLSIVSERIYKVSEEAQSFSEGNSNTSVGLRLEMWKAAAKVSLDNPLLGVGHSNGNVVVSEYVSGATKDIVLRFSHLHNEFLTTYIEQGVLGLLSVFALILLPGFVSIRRINKGVSVPLSTVCLLVVVGYLVFGMTNLVFGNDKLNAFFALILAITLPINTHKLSGIKNS